MIRRGNLNKGTKQIEIAASLDPDNALTRSYLGKAYFEKKRIALARSEYATAKRLDPNDPTPWFYSALLKQWKSACYASWVWKKQSSPEHWYPSWSRGRPAPANARNSPGRLQ